MSKLKQNEIWGNKENSLKTCWFLKVFSCGKKVRNFTHNGLAL